jgi:hypothetical protein
VEEHFADAFKPNAIPDIQPTIDEASGRSDAAETISALDTLDERIKQHLESGNKTKDATPRRRRSAEEPWRAPAPQPASLHHQRTHSTTRTRTRARGDARTSSRTPLNRDRLRGGA